MRRRKFLKTAAVVSAVGATGCVSSEGERPPRRSSVFREIEAEEGEVVVELVSNPTVTTMVDEDSDAPVGFVGVASAAKGRGRGARGGRGATRRGSRSAYRSAPKAGRHNRAKLFWGAYAVAWYDDHDDEVETEDMRVEEVGVAKIENYEDNPPGPGKMNWDKVYQASSGEDLSVDLAEVSGGEPGWYRVSAHLVSDGYDFGWESVDFLVELEDGVPDVERQWKVSPRIQG